MHPIINKGWISLSKSNQICRIFVVNLCRIGPDTKEKIEQMKIKSTSEQIDLWLFSSSNRKWDSYVIEKIENKMK